MKFLINGREHNFEVDPDTKLLGLLRDHVGLTGTKYGCGEGQCGACTVILDGVAKRSCTVPATEAAEMEIITIEGLGSDSALHPVQEAFLKHGAFQCGYCTPGMIVTLAAFLQKNSNPSEAEIVKAVDRNICRCCTFPRIIAAAKDAAAQMKGERQ